MLRAQSTFVGEGGGEYVEPNFRGLFVGRQNHRRGPKSAYDFQHGCYLFVIN